MADLEREILDKVGKYNLSELDIISYRQQKDESRPKTMDIKGITLTMSITCLLYTSPSPRDAHESRMPSSA